MNFFTKIAPKSQRGKGLVISYAKQEYKGWSMLVGYTESEALCYASFSPDPLKIKEYYPYAAIVKDERAPKTALRNWVNGQEVEGDVYAEGTDFQIKIWQELLTISRGTTREYLAVAKAIGRPKSYRAAANAIGANPITLFVPCHRAIHSDGRITGYNAGPEMKKKILDLELESRC